MMESFSFPQFQSQVHVALYVDVKNAPQLRKRIIGAAVAHGEEGEQERQAVNFAFVNARLITSRLHLETAIYQAILAECHSSLRTKTVHSEVLWALNPTNNITEAIRRYGVSDATVALFVIRIGGSLSNLRENMDAVISGNIVPFVALESITDWAMIKKHHRLNSETATQDAQTHKQALIDNIVISMVAMKAVMA